MQGFDTDPYVITSHNPPYYQRLFEQAGWQKSIDWYAFRGMADVFRKELDPALFHPGAARAEAQWHLRARTLDLRHHLDRDAGIVRDIFATAWNRNWGHVPLSEKEFDRLKEGVKQFVVRSSPSSSSWTASPSPLPFPSTTPTRR